MSGPDPGTTDALPDVPRRPRHFRRGWRAIEWRILAGVVLLVAGAIVVASALVDEDLFEPIVAGAVGVRGILRTQGYLGAMGLLYVEESGIPVPAPGDVFVLYVGAHAPKQPLQWLAAFAGVIAAVLLGSSNLYLISRNFGRKLVEGRIGRVLHITPRHVARAEGWFERWGIWAIIFGRHIPGFRVPITVGAGLFRVPYRKFAVGVVISTVLWAGVFMYMGLRFGARIEAFMLLHRETYWLIPVVVAVLLLMRILAGRGQEAPGQAPPD
ncbi:MAG TPA: DedA family protein [Candidatus Dormibacteraeota bacterium]|jgi:membrane protein DedA with SNARE-associated domain|nr:DedA family protein [Candidatus Dormibacteraeota bacterium]